MLLQRSGPLVLILATLLLKTEAENVLYQPRNITRTTLSGPAAYYSQLTLDWLADEDERQRELAVAFETESAPPARLFNSDCAGYARPASGKVARLMLELLKNLEGDDSSLITELTHALIRAKLLVETYMLDAEPDLDALVRVPSVMMGEPYANFPRVLAMVWMAATDPTTTKNHGWCLINRVTKYLRSSRPVDIAVQLRSLDPIIARARFIVEDFIQHVTPISVYDKSYGYGGTKPNRTRGWESVTRTSFKKRARTPNEPLAVTMSKEPLNRRIFEPQEADRYEREMEITDFESPQDGREVVAHTGATDETRGQVVLISLILLLLLLQ